MKAFTVGAAIGLAAIAAGLVWLSRQERRWLREVAQ